MSERDQAIFAFFLKGESTERALLDILQHQSKPEFQNPNFFRAFLKYDAQLSIDAIPLEYTQRIIAVIDDDFSQVKPGIPEYLTPGKINLSNVMNADTLEKTLLEQNGDIKIIRLHRNERGKADLSTFTSDFNQLLRE